MATATKKKSLKRNGVSNRHPKMTALENQIVQNGVDAGVSKVLAVKQLRTWENQGDTPEEIAERLGVTTSTGQTVDSDGPSAPVQPDKLDDLLAAIQPDELDDLLAAMTGPSDDDKDESF